MSARKVGGDGLVVAGSPRVHLLPPEIEGQRKERAFRRTLVAVLAGSVLLVIIAVGAISLLLAVSLAGQAAEQQQGVLLAQQLKKYSSVTGVQTQVDRITGAQPVAVKGEILWEPFIASIQGTLPAGVSITSFTAKLDPSSGGAAAGDPLTGEHVAIVSVTALGPQDLLTPWLNKLLTLKGVVNATPGAVAISPDPAFYVVNVDLLISSDVVANRFVVGKN